MSDSLSVAHILVCGGEASWQHLGEQNIEVFLSGGVGKLITDFMSLSVYFFKVWVGGLWAASLSGKSRLHRRSKLCCFCSCNFCRKPQRKDFFFMQTEEKSITGANLHGAREVSVCNNHV